MILDIVFLYISIFQGYDCEERLKWLKVIYYVQPFFDTSHITRQTLPLKCTAEYITPRMEIICTYLTKFFQGQREIGNNGKELKIQNSTAFLISDSSRDINKILLRTCFRGGVPGNVLTYSTWSGKSVCNIHSSTFHKRNTEATLVLESIISPSACCGSLNYVPRRSSTFN